MPTAVGNASDREQAKQSRTTFRRRVRRALGRALQPATAPLAEWVRHHQQSLRRWGGPAGLVIGLAALVGGLQPLGLSLILVAVAVLLAEWEQREESRRNDGRSPGAK